MIRKPVSELSRSLMDIAWYFGPQGLDGECCENVSMPEFLALDKAAATSDCPVQDIGSSIGFTKSGATRVVNRLVQKGYVKKIRSHEDGRFCCVVVTEQGMRILRAADAQYLSRFERLAAHVPELATARIKELLVKIAASVKQSI